MTRISQINTLRGLLEGVLADLTVILYLDSWRVLPDPVVPLKDLGGYSCCYSTGTFQYLLEGVLSYSFVLSKDFQRYFCSSFTGTTRDFSNYQRSQQPFLEDAADDSPTPSTKFVELLTCNSLSFCLKNPATSLLEKIYQISQKRKKRGKRRQKFYVQN